MIYMGVTSLLGSCVYNQYTLPQFDFIGGTTQKYTIPVSSVANISDSEAKSYRAAFAIVNYVNRDCAPIISKEATLDTTGKFITISLSPNETLNLTGKFVYQVSLRSENSNSEYHGQGLLIVARNIDRTGTVLNPYRNKPITWGNLKNGFSTAQTVTIADGTEVAY